MSNEQHISRNVKNITGKILEEKNPKVNINDLLSKIKNEKNKETKENVIFISLVFGVVAVTGVIASL